MEPLKITKTDKQNVMESTYSFGFLFNKIKSLGHFLSLWGEFNLILFVRSFSFLFVGSAYMSFALIKSYLFLSHLSCVVLISFVLLSNVYDHTILYYIRWFLTFNSTLGFPFTAAPIAFTIYSWFSIVPHLLIFVFLFQKITCLLLTIHVLCFYCVDDVAGKKYQV